MKMITFFALLLSLWGCSALKSSQSFKQALGIQTLPATPEAPAAIFEAKNTKNWKYSTKTDEMDSEKTFIAASHSTNSHNLSFPYHGGTAATLVIYKYPNFRLIAVFVDKGQISFGMDESMRVKFGSNAPVSFTPQEDSNGDRTHVTLGRSDSVEFINLIKSASTTKIELEFYGDGRRTFDFNVESLQRFFLED